MYKTAHTTLSMILSTENFDPNKSVKINSVNPLYLIFINVNGYFEEINGKTVLMLVHNGNKEKIKKNMKNCGEKSEI